VINGGEHLRGDLDCPTLVTDLCCYGQFSLPKINLPAEPA
jgi:hypothetical protein